MSSESTRQALAEARLLVANGKVGSLSIIDFESGGPFVSLVNFAVDETGRPIFLFSDLARHTKCIQADRRASLLVCEPLPATGDALTASRVTVTGRMEQTQHSEAAGFYLARHPYAEMYASFGDFHFWRLVPEQAFLVGGFGKIFRFSATEFFAQ